MVMVPCGSTTSCHAMPRHTTSCPAAIMRSTCEVQNGGHLQHSNAPINPHQHCRISVCHMYLPRLSRWQTLLELLGSLAEPVVPMALFPYATMDIDGAHMPIWSRRFLDQVSVACAHCHILARHMNIT